MQKRLSEICAVYNKLICHIATTKFWHHHKICSIKETKRGLFHSPCPVVRRHDDISMALYKAIDILMMQSLSGLCLFIAVLVYF